MRALIIGGDHVDAAKRALYASGYTEVVHWTGRKNNDLKRPLPAGVTHMVIMLEFVSNTLARKMKTTARSQRISVAFVGRKQGGQAEVATRLQSTPDTAALRYAA